jgi:type I restriction enzyme S subunit
MHVGRDKRIPIAMSEKDEAFMVSPAYEVFEIKDTKELLPEYAMMWFRRAEYDRYAWFQTDADVRGGLPWKSFIAMQIPVPPISRQRELVTQYNTIQRHINQNNALIEKLEQTAQAVYKEWFVDKVDREKTKLIEYIETNPQLQIKKGMQSAYVEMSDLSETSMSIANKKYREYNGGSKFQNNDTLLARITPCLENGKTAFVDILDDNEIAAGSTEFIVMRALKNVSPYWVYCLARDENFRSYAISSMIGSSGRQRVHEKYLEVYNIPLIKQEIMDNFHKYAKIFFETIKLKSQECQKLEQLKTLLLSRMASIEKSSIFAVDNNHVFTGINTNK